ncbi:hypothetical protein SAMN04488074_102402 [Lentzea albidocapillata subsp. violacea]|uniref:Uncharacterized protein n=1 Tax=Lentzea albidocapillata subsp. violacea TaxID=128104 RepID=A0A1G8UT87_9PSEU|nr:hypothetical protein [Lentzea albidocapillata]SDJ57013.1 hypothetical protein SAMN04488074_102402 [Lentzea albidocapillata subsp. violacea]
MSSPPDPDFTDFDLSDLDVGTVRGQAVAAHAQLPPTADAPPPPPPPAQQ